ncbi:winged helix-turn-helix domain-containing protein [Paraburkholderia sp. DHOC27]|uniref:ATP-binding protein n=1 Tax=Paraburkholderia sp. DHOC27 TaxID=2303330 RepID=UPI000E3BBB03|nr:winged helix-turn-helix domain-containing protein [Paraburkholderia sp. DHOC27]RFU48356.1 transcriptional regulator [Paraburkholderia sp. DHOC27]
MQPPPASHDPTTEPDPRNANGIAYLFGSFRLIPSQQTLLDGDSRVVIGGRALDLLTALVERRGELITKKELMARAWPRSVVEESNLKVHIAALRKALGEGPQTQRFVATVVGRGYRFVAPVEHETMPLAGAPLDTHLRVAHNVPAALVRPIGRTEAIRDLLSRLARVRLLTVTGPGGIGKTTVALAVAHEMVEAGEHDVWFVNLSRLSAPGFVPHAVANAVGLAVHSDDIPRALANYFRLRNRPQLVILDSCEHVIEAVAILAEQITAAAPQMHVLGTSREPLQVVGEHVYRLEPLETPPDSARLTVDEALQYSAVELFVERATAASGAFTLTDEAAPAVAQICRRLDGIALAIELAATRLDAFGVQELLHLLDDRFATLAQGSRTAPERQKTLLATLDWSHQLLPEVERVVLRRLGIFPGVFSLGSAAAVGGDDTLPYARAIDAVASLVAKSMLSANAASDSMRYRLLDTTRDYARRKLVEAGEWDTVARCHAVHFLDVYARTEECWSRPPDARWLEDHKPTLDDVRAALNWAFSTQGDAALGIALTVSAIPAWVRLSSLEECRSRVEYALQRAEGGTCTPLSALPVSAFDTQRMKLYTALAASALYTRGMVSQVDSAWTNAFAIAERLDDKEYQLRSMFAGCCGLVYAGRHGEADELLRKFRAIAQATHNEVSISEGSRITAFAWHHMGRQAEARRLVEAVLEWYAAPSHRSPLSDNHVRGLEGTRSLMASVLWFQGFPERARAEAQRARDDAQAGGHTLTVGYVLVFAFIPLALYAGDLDAAQEAMITLQDSVASNDLILFDAMTRGLHGAVLLKKQDPAGLAILSDALEQLRREHIGMRYSMFAGLYAQGLLGFGREREALTTIEEALAWSKAHDELWCIAELLRIKGDILAGASGLDPLGESEALYWQALESAQQQGALFLELRAAMSMARLKHRQGETAQAESVLVAAYDKFTEGFATADLQQARALLDSFQIGLRTTDS